MRIIFMGSPEFALPSLEALHRSHDVIAVYTQPDRRSGRGRKLLPPPVKELAEQLAITIYQPSSLKDENVSQDIQSMQPDMIVVAAYGKILPPEILNIPKIACINVHASLLPRWRGAAPIQAAILSGDDVTGISIMRMDPGLDTGPVYYQATTKIASDETSGELSRRLAILGATALESTLSRILNQQLEPQPQVEALATYAPILKKEDGLLNFRNTASYLARQVRAYEPWPSSFFYWKRNRLVIRSAEAIDHKPLPYGTCLEYKSFPAIAADSGILVLRNIQPAGKRSMPGDTFLNGAKDFCDGRITDTPNTES